MSRQSLGFGVLLLFLGSVPLHAATAETRIVWVDGKAHADVAIDAKPIEGLKEIEVPLELFDAKGVRLWNTVLKVPAIGAAPWKARVALQNIKEPTKQHSVTTSLHHDGLDIHYSEEIFFAAETALVQTYGMMTQGAFPQRKVFFELGLNAFPVGDLRDIPVSLKTRDGEDNVVNNRQTVIHPAREAKQHVLDVTPDTSTAVGPFTLEVSIESEANKLFFNTSHRFAQANALVPFTSMEHGEPGMWFAADPKVHPQQYRSLQYYYSEHLRDMYPRDNPKLTYDREVKHSGRQSLRIDYQPQGEAHVWSLQSLPGKPLALSLWVKGNESNDQLLVYFEDNSNFTLPAWFRNANFSSAVVCNLNFAGWRRFRIPVLGEGLQVSGTKGSTEKIDAPIRILAFTIKPARLPTKEGPRTIWIDDLAAETQAPATDLLSMELQASEPHGRLTADGSLAVTVGNGHPVDLKRGKLSVMARDAGNNPVWTRTEDLVVPAGSYEGKEIPLKDLAARKPRGPIDIDVTFQDQTRPAARVTRRITLKSATQGGIVFDFEEAVTFNGYQPGKAGPSKVRIVAGGAEGSKHALALPVQPGELINSVLFHPALPGVVDRVEMMVHGGDKPVLLQAWFIDSANTGIWLRPHNLFWADPVVVDWQGWRKVSIPAPPIPAYHGDKNRYFLFKPWYPLNLALNARLPDGDQPVEIKIDNVRVVTHMADDEQLRAQVEFPDETHIHPPGSPLRVVLSNFAPTAANLQLRYELRNYQGFVAREGKLPVTLAPGVKQKVTLADSLAPGIYDLRVQGIGKEPLTACIMVLNARDYFGEDPTVMLGNPLLLRKQLNLMTERLYQDWDNSEPAPYLHHIHWFEQELKKLREIKMLPKELEGIAAKFDAANAVAVQAEKELKTAQGQAVTAANAEKPAAAKVEAVSKQVSAAQAEVEAMAKQVTAATEKSTAADKESVTEKTREADALKAVQKAEADVKTAREAMISAEKAATDADKAAKDAEAKAKKEQTDDAKKAAAMKRDEADKAKAKLAAARTELQTLMGKVQPAKQAADQAAKKAQAAARTADQFKSALKAADQKLQAARKKADDAGKVLEANKRDLSDRIKATQDANATIVKLTKALDTAKAEAEVVSQAFEQAKAKYYFTLLPVVGFSAEWAGPEAVDTIQKNTYHRWIPNRIQVPRRMVDWSQFVRTIQREYKGRFDTWVFWENPDLDDSPQNIPPAKYAPMLDIFARWVKLYNPNARVVAGGFNFHKSIAYLQRIPEAYKLPFDEFAVQMNLGELSPEHADMEGYLDDLNALLKIRETKRTVRLTELDWAIGKYVTPMQQAAYHARAAMILDSRGVPPHQFNLLNSGFEFDGYGVFYRVAYGNTADLQTFEPAHIPKPAYFALTEMSKFLRDWKYVASVNLSDKSLAYNRAFIYRNAAGELTAAIWRAVDGQRLYKVPPQWRGVVARDVFGFPVSLDTQLRCTPLPALLEMPAGYQVEQLLHDLRTLEAIDGSYPVLLDLHLAEPDSVRRAGYQMTGQVQTVVRAGAIPGDRKVREPYLDGLETEQFTFQTSQGGNVLLRRRWHFQGEGQKLFVRLNDGPEMAWDLRKGQGNDPGVRETTFVLSHCKTGANRVAIRSEKPGNCAGYRLETMPADHVPLDRWGILNTRQTKGEVVKFNSVVGTPLVIGAKTYESGIGAHAVSFIEYPLDGQFTAFEVTVGVDGSTEGRGSVVFRIYVDGKERANSGLITGSSRPPTKTLKVDRLDGARRLILSVTDAEDGNRDDLANWVDGKLYLKMR